jgi:hypothetical protein
MSVSMEPPMESTRTSTSARAAQTIRLFLLVEAATFIVAAAAHFGVAITGYEDPAAAVAESAISVVLLSGYAATWIRPAKVAVIGIASQAFAFVFTLVGVFTIAIGIGPSTVPDIVYHLAIVAVMAWGIAVANRARSFA